MRRDKPRNLTIHNFQEKIRDIRNVDKVVLHRRKTCQRQFQDVRNSQVESDSLICFFGVLSSLSRRDVIRVFVLPFIEG